ncbi:MAG: hypothetical protein HQL45_16505 [Alphaproteobacteria bacterium]|nr:hypothetical protein [Alphaproteobacteria bacterium]
MEDDEISDINEEGIKHEGSAMHMHADRFYSSVLTSMWEQYVKFLNVGLIGIAAFFGLIVSLIKNGERFSVIEAVPLAASIVFVSLSGILFIYCRWISQVLMERQVYGDFNSAKKYFDRVGGNEPKALTGKTETQNKAFVSKYSLINEACTYTAIVFSAIGFILSVYVLIYRLFI